MISKSDELFLDPLDLISQYEANVIIPHSDDIMKIHALGSLLEHKNLTALLFKRGDVFEGILIVFPGNKIFSSDGGLRDFASRRGRCESGQDNLFKSGTITGPKKSTDIEDGANIVEQKDFHLKKIRVDL